MLKIEVKNTKYKLKIQVFIYTNEEDFAKISKACNIFLSKIQLSYCYTQLCNCRKVNLSLLVTNQIFLWVAI